jgi:hypothetical protein
MQCSSDIFHVDNELTSFPLAMEDEVVDLRKI